MMSLALPSPAVFGAEHALTKKKVADAGGATTVEPMRFVLTGEFTSSKYKLDVAAEQVPGLQKGKAAVTRLIKSFGGKVSAAISECVSALAWRPLACRALSRPYSPHSIYPPPNPPLRHPA
jgi:hypothetical protein